MTKAKRPTIKGLFLWQVQIETCTLWITTRRKVIEHALSKARKVMAKDYPTQQIKGISSHGFLDA